ncbi:type II secretion system protein [Candidatus Saccharibacteria bacterium]|nr:type II secretion system protein [Candidatus Saccharibacteria bacterium]
MRRPRSAKGFTIVELLIVIVVIGILAMIAFSTFRDTPARAQNANRISTAKAAVRLIYSYMSATGNYPDTTGASFCLGRNFPTGKCWGENSATPTNEADSLAFVNSIAAVAGKVNDITYQPVNIGTWNGIGPVYHYRAHAPYRTVDGQPRPAMLMYWLEGLNVDCGMSGIIQPDPAPAPGTIANDNVAVYVYDTTMPRNSMYGGQGTYCILSLNPPN